MDDGNKRPAANPSRTPTDWVVELAAIVGLALSFVILLLAYPDLPNTVPTHFGVSGKPDGWGNKSSLFLLPAVGVGLYLLLTVLNLIPRMFNYPWRITRENALRQYQIARSLLTWVKAEIIWMMLSILLVQIQVAEGNTEGLGLLLVPAFLGVIFITIAIYFWLSFKAR